jgi:hypothetical protein
VAFKGVVCTSLQPGLQIASQRAVKIPFKKLSVEIAGARLATGNRGLIRIQFIGCAPQSERKLV